MISTTLTARSGARGLLVNADTGEPIRWAFRADLEAGTYSAYRIDPKQAKARGIPLAGIVYHGRARLRWEAAEIIEAPPSPTVLAPPVQRQGVRVLALQSRPCQAYGCCRAADWKVADTVDLPSVEVEGRLFAATDVVGVRFYCSHHFRPPQRINPDGSRDNIEVKARPD